MLDMTTLAGLLAAVVLLTGVKDRGPPPAWVTLWVTLWGAGWFLERFGDLIWLLRLMTALLVWVLAARLTVTAWRERRRAEPVSPSTAGETEAADRLLEVTAHELSNPLAAIETAIALILEEKGGSRDVQRAGRTIAQQVRQLRRLVEDLTDTDSHASGTSLRPEACDLRDILYNASEAVRPEIRRREQRLLSQVVSVSLRADPQRLCQVFTNLLVNASRHSGLSSEIRVVVLPGDREVLVLVDDDGPGVRPEQIPGLFERRRRSALEGHGLGLSVVRSLVERHGGQVEVRPGPGGHFGVRLPLGEAGLTRQGSDEPSTVSGPKEHRT